MSAHSQAVGGICRAVRRNPYRLQRCVISLSFFRSAVAVSLLTVAVIQFLSLPGHAATVPARVPEASGTSLTAAQAMVLAERHNPNLRLARYQLKGAQQSLRTAPANAAALAPAAAAYAQLQFGVTISESAISADVAQRQAQIDYEQAALQYYQARQQVRLGALRAFTEWQRAEALTRAQMGALTRVESQVAQVKAAMEAGMVARFDLLQAEAQVAGQQAALAGAQAYRESAKQALEEAVGKPLAADLQPGGELLTSDEVIIGVDVEQLTARALVRRADVRLARLDMEARRLQLGLASGDSAAASLQLQAAATQYEATVLKVRTEVEQSLLGVNSALAELKAREAAMAPVREAQRLAELRYGAGLTTYLEVLTASETVLQAEAAQIEAATNLALGLLKLAQGVGDL